jgi:hypothetical protein
MEEKFVDNDRFDTLTRALGQGRSRRTVVKGLAAAALGAVGLRRLGSASAQNLGNSPCAHFCVALYPPGPERGDCISAAAQGQGICPSCGADATNVCQATDGTIYCPDFQTDPANCGGCGAVCSQPANGSATCSGGGCVITCNDGYEPDGTGGCVAISTCGACPSISTPDGACYWLDCVSYGGLCCWDLNGFYAGDPTSCQALDSCAPGGGGGSGGGCYKWDTQSC